MAFRNQAGDADRENPRDNREWWVCGKWGAHAVSKGDSCSLAPADTKWKQNGPVLSDLRIVQGNPNILMFMSIFKMLANKSHLKKTV